MVRLIVLRNLFTLHVKQLHRRICFEQSIGVNFVCSPHFVQDTICDIDQNHLCKTILQITISLRNYNGVATEESEVNHAARARINESGRVGCR